MGGYGSGKYQSYHSKMLVESTTRLSIFDLRKHNVVYGKHCTGSGTGPNGFLLRFTLAKDTLSLEYVAHSQRHTLSVRMVTTQPHYGGFRTWFVCPRCGRRCGILYIHAHNVHFACRVCANLNYLSTRQESQHKLMLRMQAQVQSFDRRMARRQAIVDRILAKERTASTR